jgi:hypothetical protein
MQSAFIDFGFLSSVGPLLKLSISSMSPTQQWLHMWQHNGWCSAYVMWNWCWVQHGVRACVRDRLA